MMRLPDEVILHLRDVADWPDVPPDRYEIRALLGRGGMGAVYAARDRVLGREVALKVSNAPVAGTGLDARLRQEASVLARLEHPGIVPVHDAGALADGRWFYVMKLVRGQTLTDLVATLAGEAPVLGVFERVAETVAFAHAAGIVHRDLKPSNIMIGRFGEVLVLDWGVAKILASVAPAVPEETAGSVPNADGTGAGIRIGTAGFMAPEQQRGEASTAGSPADVFSLGALLFWMLTGRSAPPTEDETSRALAALREPPGRRLRAIVRKCLAPEAPDRYPDAAALVEDLARYRAGLAVVAHPESAFERAWRWLDRYRTFIMLVAAYLVMRAAFAWFQR